MPANLRLKSIAFCLIFSLYSSVQANESLQTIQHQISQQQQKISQKLNDKTTLHTALQQLNATFDQHDQTLQKLQENLEKNQRSQQATLQEKIVLDRQFSKQKQQLKQVINAIYKANINPSFAEKLLSDDQSNKLILKQYLNRLYQQKIQLLQATQKTQNALNANQKTLQQQQQAYKAQQKTAQQLRQQQVALKAEQQKLLRALEQSIAQEQQTLAKLKQDENALRIRIANALKAKQQQALLAQAKQQLGRPHHQYPWPLQGKILYQFGTPQLGELRWQGIVIQGKEGQNVKAIAAGKVLMAGTFSGYGQLVIVQHGTQDITLYGYNSRLLVKKDDIVRAGQTIALVGHLPSNSLRGKTGLYFEITQRGKSLDPLQWLKK